MLSKVYKLKTKPLWKINCFLSLAAWHQTVYYWNFRDNVHKVLDIFQNTENIEALFMLMSGSNEQLVSGTRIEITGREIAL